MTNKIALETPLHYLHGKQSGSGQGITVEESVLLGHLIIRGQSDDANLKKEFHNIVGLALPDQPCTCYSSADRTVYWLSPTEWLLILDKDELSSIHAILQKTLQGHVALIDVSGGQTKLTITGKEVSTLLKKSSVYDFHNDNFSGEKCVQTTFAKAGALVRKSGPDQFELVIRRSFSDYIVAWILDAAAEMGCVVTSPLVE